MSDGTRMVVFQEHDWRLQMKDGPKSLDTCLNCGMMRFQHLNGTFYYLPWTRTPEEYRICTGSTYRAMGTAAESHGGPSVSAARGPVPSNSVSRCQCGATYPSGWVGTCSICGAECGAKV